MTSFHWRRSAFQFISTSARINARLKSSGFHASAPSSVFAASSYRRNIKYWAASSETFTTLRGVQRQCLLEVMSRVLPIALSSLNVAAERKDPMVIRQAASGQHEFCQRGRIIPVATIVKQDPREMDFTAVGLEACSRFERLLRPIEPRGRMICVQPVQNTDAWWLTYRAQG